MTKLSNTALETTLTTYKIFRGSSLDAKNVKLV
jgi:hypothetical protein